MSVSQFVLAGMSDIDRDGFVMSSVGNTDLIARIVRESGWWSFEQPLPALVVRCGQVWPGLMVDVGANTGFYSLLHASVDPANRSMAFEPFPPAAQVLRDNVALNLFGEVVSVRTEAVSAFAGQAELFVPPQLHGLLESRSSLERTFSDVHEAVLPVTTLPLDSIQAELSDLTILKIDVEGHEASVLAGARETIAARRPLIAVGILGGDHAALNAMTDRERYRAVVLGGEEVIERPVLAPDPRGWNHILVPEEKWPAFADIVSSAGLRLSAS